MMGCMAAISGNRSKKTENSHTDISRTDFRAAMKKGGFEENRARALLCAGELIAHAIGQQSDDQYDDYSTECHTEYRIES